MLGKEKLENLSTGKAVIQNAVVKVKTGQRGLLHATIKDTFTPSFNV